MHAWNVYNMIRMVGYRYNDAPSTSLLNSSILFHGSSSEKEKERKLRISWFTTVTSFTITIGGRKKCLQAQDGKATVRFGTKFLVVLTTPYLGLDQLILMKELNKISALHRVELFPTTAWPHGTIFALQGLANLQSFSLLLAPTYSFMQGDHWIFSSSPNSTYYSYLHAITGFYGSDWLGDRSKKFMHVVTTSEKMFGSTYQLRKEKELFDVMHMQAGRREKAKQKGGRRDVHACISLDT